MAFSLYYTAKRTTPVTKQESDKIAQIVKEYCSDYPYDKKTEDFGVYEDNDDRDENIIFRGATKLPGRSVYFMYDVANYWLECLTDITAELPECEWEVTMDDVELIWDSDEYWRFPTDEEYRQMKKDS